MIEIGNEKDVRLTNSLVSPLYVDIGPATLVDDGEGEAPHVGLNLGIVKLAADETLGVEDPVNMVSKRR